MAEDAGDKLAEGKLDLVPLIDCIVLMLLFFILTTKFSSEEKAIQSLLPTDKGQAAGPSKKTDIPKLVNISIWPAGMSANRQPEEYQKTLQSLYDAAPGRILGDAMIRVGGDDPFRIEGRILAMKGSSENERSQQQALLQLIHARVQKELEAREKADSVVRKDQFPVNINCFSGLSWKFSLVAYDAVRQYERLKGGVVDMNNPRAIENQREVNFAPPRIRNYSMTEQGNELFEIINLMK